MEKFLTELPERLLDTLDGDFDISDYQDDGCIYIHYDELPDYTIFIQQIEYSDEEVIIGVLDDCNMEIDSDVVPVEDYDYFDVKGIANTIRFLVNDLLKE